MLTMLILRIYTHIFEKTEKQNANKIYEVFKNMNQNVVVTNL